MTSQTPLLQEIDVYTATVAYSEVEFTGGTPEEALFRAMHNEVGESVQWWVRKVKHTPRSITVIAEYTSLHTDNDNTYIALIYVWPRKMYIPVSEH